MLIGVGLLIAGLAIPFGTVGAAVGALFGGVGMLIVGFHDWITTGELTTQTFWLLEAAIGAVGFALGVLVGWPAVVVAAVAAAALAIYHYWDEIKVFFINRWEEIKAVCSTMAEWVNVNVVIPISNFFMTLGTNIALFFSDAWTRIRTGWNVVTGWFNDTIITPVKTAFDQMCQTVGGFFSSLWNTIVGVFAGAGQWFQTNVVDVITLGFKNMVNGAIGLFESMLNGIIQTLNWIIGKVNSVLNAFGGNGIKYLSKVKIARFAEGGFPDQGQLFIAQEAGAEMVGSIGRRAAVANNDQIVEAVKAGVYEAVVAATGGGNNQNGGQAQVVSANVNGKNLFEFVVDYARGETVRTGANPLLEF